MKIGALGTELEESVRVHGKTIVAIKERLSQLIVGQENLIDRLLIALLSDGHILLEGMPGLAKTLVAQTLARVLSSHFVRVQFTPDLLPSDLLGTTIYNAQEGSFKVKKGPLFAQLILADEINRAPAKVQSALLEAMQEGQITLDGISYPLPKPFLVMATQNPIEHEGTYPLPEAQLDRFMLKVKVPYPLLQQERDILRRLGSLTRVPQVESLMPIEALEPIKKTVEAIYFDEKIEQYILDIIFATREPQNFAVDMVGLLEFGASPRGSLALLRAAKAHAFLQGRAYVTPFDVKAMAPDVLRHRLRLSYEAEVRSFDVDKLIAHLLHSLRAP